MQSFIYLILHSCNRHVTSELSLFIAQPSRHSRPQIQSVWSMLKESSGYADRVRAVADFNKANRWRKRGLSIIPTKFGIAFTATFMNQVTDSYRIRR
jgi:xanthine dehydrogenase molybdopterin-binding subunit B